VSLATDVTTALEQLRGVELGEVLLDSGLRYGDGEPVEILMRRRGRRYDLDDRGVSVEKARAAGAPRRWLKAAELVVAEEGMNVNRRGVVFVSAVEGRDLSSLALRLADVALAVYDELLALADE
jgi:hypothetical protein